MDYTSITQLIGCWRRCSSSGVFAIEITHRLFKIDDRISLQQLNSQASRMCPRNQIDVKKRRLMGAVGYQYTISVRQATTRTLLYRYTHGAYSNDTLFKSLSLERSIQVLAKQNWPETLIWHCKNSTIFWFSVPYCVFTWPNYTKRIHFVNPE